MDLRKLKDSAADYFKRGRFGKAAEAYAQLCQREPSEAQHKIKLGDSYRRDGKREQAIKAYRAAVQGYTEQGVFIKAIAACKLVLELDPSHQDAQEELANLLDKRYHRTSPLMSSPSPKPGLAPAPAGSPYEAIDLPEYSEEGSFVSSGGETLDLDEPPAPKRAPPIAAIPKPVTPPSLPRISPHGGRGIDSDSESDGSSQDFSRALGFITPEEELPAYGEGEALIPVILDEPVEAVAKSPEALEFLDPSALIEVDSRGVIEFDLDPPDSEILIRPEDIGLVAIAPEPLPESDGDALPLAPDAPPAVLVPASPPAAPAPEEQQATVTPAETEGSSGHDRAEFIATELVEGEALDAEPLGEEALEILDPEEELFDLDDLAESPPESASAPSSVSDLLSDSLLSDSLQTTGEDASKEELELLSVTMDEKSWQAPPQAAVPATDSSKAPAAQPQSLDSDSVEHQAPTIILAPPPALPSGSALAEAASASSDSAKSPASPEEPPSGQAADGAHDSEHELQFGSEAQTSPSSEQGKQSTQSEDAAPSQPSTLDGVTPTLQKTAGTERVPPTIYRPMAPRRVAPQPQALAPDFSGMGTERLESEQLANEAFEVSLDSLGEEEPAAIEVSQESVPLFGELSREAFLDLLQRLELQRHDTGEVVLQEGDAGRSIFILVNGKLKVVKGLGEKQEMELAVLQEGAFFGEMALLNGAPRVASVVAVGEAEVLEIKEHVLQELVARHPGVANSLRKFYRQRLLSNVMAISPIFASLSRKDRLSLLERFKIREVSANTTICKEGEANDGLYVVMHGSLAVSREHEGKARQLAVLAEGQIFGESSLLSQGVANATVTTLRKTLLLRLPRSDFHELILTHPTVLEVLSSVADEREAFSDELLSGSAG